jgi:serine protease Do
VVGRDRKLDLALLKIEDGPDDLPAVVLGDSDVLRVGETVVAVGNPFGLGHTVTLGIVSALARSIGAGPYDAFIQTDASINPGNSGGPLFNLRGEVVGINTAIRAGADGIGFAIPVQSLKDVVPQLRDKGFVERGKLGLMFQPVTPEIAKALSMELPHGAMVHDLERGGAADRAGIKPGDVIVAVNGSAIVRAEELPRKVARHAPGSAIDVDLLRGGKIVAVRATLDKLAVDDEEPGKPKPSAPSPKTDTMLGMEVTDAPDGGVQVRSTSPKNEGLRRGDIIVEVNGEAVSNVEQFRAKLNALGSRQAVLLKVRRDDGHRYVAIPVTH